jgi:hypothetical protein
MSKARDLADLAKNANDRLDIVATSDGALSNRNILINGNLTVNQRGGSVASAPIGNYGEDRWKKTAGGMTQIIEEVNYLPSTVYTLSGTNVTTQQITSPASGNWTLPDIPVTARLVQLEIGDTATPFEHRSYGQELALCQRYFVNEVRGIWSGVATLNVAQYVHSSFPVEMRATPTCTVDAAGVPVLAFPTSPSLNVARPKGVLVQNTANANSVYGYFNYHVVADAEL